MAKRQNQRRPVRRRVTWQALAWIAGAAAVAAVVLSLLVASAVNHQTSPQTPTVAAGSLTRGQPPPDFTATTFDGQQLNLSSLKGHPVLVNFFASWCTQCKGELPFMEQSYERRRADGFVIVGVNGLETGDGVGFYHHLGLTFPAVYDPGNPARSRPPTTSHQAFRCRCSSTGADAWTSFDSALLRRTCSSRRFRR